jgi:tetratricopeptide (TPR) repeat protein
VAPAGNAAATWHRGPLAAVLAAVLRRQAGAAVALQGEAGIGKTHALRIALTTAPCRYRSLHATAPLAEAVPNARPKALPLLADTILAQVARGEAVEPAAAAAAFVDLMQAQAPFVLAFEDAHEADEARLAFFVEVGRRARAARGTAVVLTTRHAPPLGFLAVRVEPKGVDEVHALLEEEIGARVPDAAVDWIHDRAAGNPLFALEYFRHLARLGHVWSDGRTWHWRAPAVASLPTTVEALLEDPIRTARAVPELAAVLEARAALERAPEPEVVARVADLGAAAVRRADRALTLRGVLRDGDFAHPLVRDVARATTPRDRRRTLAQRAVRAFADAPDRAARFVADADLPAEEALAILTAAAERVRAHDEAQAGRWLAAAVPFAPPERGARLATEAARWLQHTDQGEARRLLGTALAVVPDDPEAVLLLAELEALEGREDAVHALVARLPEGLREGGAWTERHLKLRFAMGDHQAVVDAWSAWPAATRPSPDVAYRAGFALVVQHRLAEADALAAEASTDATTAIDRARLLTVRGLAAAYAGETTRAAPFLEEAVAMARASGQKAYLAATLHNRATLYEETNHVSGMLDDAREALRLYAEVRNTRHYASTLTKVARITHELGRYEEAEARLLESRAIHQQARPSAFAVTCEAHLCDLYLDWRSPHAPVLAHKHASAAVALAHQVQDHDKLPMALTCMAVVEARAGRPERGVALLEEIAAVQPDRERTTYQVLAARALVLAGLGDRTGAEAAFERAVAMAFASDWHVYAHKLGLELDSLRGDRAQAAQRLVWFEGHGLRNGAAIARRLFPELDGADPAAVGGRSEAPAAALERRRGGRAAGRPAIAGTGSPPGLGPSSTTPSAPARSSSPATETSGGAPRVRIEVLGPLRVVRDGHEVAFRGHRRRQLLALLLEGRLGGAAGLGTPELIDALYPDRDDDAAAAVSLKQLVFQTRKVLGAQALVATGAGYALGDVASDAEAFLANLDTRLWRGPFREDLDVGHGAVAGALTHGLRTAGWAQLAHDPEEAKRVGLLLLRAEPYEARALHLALAALAAAGRDEEAVACYAAARARFAEVGEVLPGAWRDWLAARAAPDGTAGSVTAPAQDGPTAPGGGALA